MIVIILFWWLHLCKVKSTFQNKHSFVVSAYLHVDHSLTRFYFCPLFWTSFHWCFYTFSLFNVFSRICFFSFLLTLLWHDCLFCFVCAVEPLVYRYPKPPTKTWPYEEGSSLGQGSVTVLWRSGLKKRGDFSSRCLSSGWSLIRVVCHWGHLSSEWPVIGVISDQGGLSWGHFWSGWSFLGSPLIRVVCHWGHLSSGWSVIGVTCHQAGLSWGHLYQGGLLLGSPHIRLVSHWGHLISLVCHWGHLSLGWSVIEVISHQGGLSWRSSLIRVVCHGGHLSSGWSVTEVISHQCGFSLGWSFIKGSTVHKHYVTRIFCSHYLALEIYLIMSLFSVDWTLCNVLIGLMLCSIFISSISGLPSLCFVLLLDFWEGVG